MTSIQLLADTMVYARWVMNEEGTTDITFRDVPEDAYYKEAVDWAVGEGITIGVGNDLFALDEICTRAKAVTFLYRYKVPQ